MMLSEPALAGATVPLTEQIYTVLKNEILDGLWVGRDVFPGEDEVAKRFGVSVITSRRALERLAADGFIERGRGRKGRVIHSPRRIALSASTVFPLNSTPFKYKVLRRGMDVASAEACDAFAVPHGSELWHIRRLRTFEGRPHSVTYNIQEPELGRLHSLKDLNKLPMAQILREAGMKPTELVRRVGVASPSVEVAKALGVPLHEPILTYTFTLLDSANKALEWVRIYCHPNEPAPQERIDFRTGQFIIVSGPPV
jgi:GntR family transcriptional regulator